MALLKHGAQALENTRSTRERKEQCRCYHCAQSSAYGLATEWELIAGSGEDLQSKSALFTR